MNAQPHTHEIRIERRYRSAGGPLQVTYGDTTVSTIPTWHGPFNLRTNHLSDRQIRKAIAKAIRRHDKGSIKAGADADAVERARRLIAELPADRWASEVVQ